MVDASPEPADACAPLTVKADDGARLTACLHGGHVLGWTPAGGHERLWVSPTFRCGPGRPIRGGIPVIFPQVAARGPLPKHGFARDRAWRPGPTPASSAGPATWSAVLEDDDQTRRVWPHPFRLTLTATAAGERLDVELEVAHTGDATAPEWSFTAALHSYLRVGPSALIRGLEGRTAEDNARSDASLSLGDRSMAATVKRDVAVAGVSRPMLLDDPEAGGPLRMDAGGFADRVVWNPGPGHGLSDVPDGAEAGFVCIEAAALTPVNLAPGQAWLGRERFVAEVVRH